MNGLQYLGEAEFSTMVSSNFAPEIAGTLNRLGAHDILQMEQYMDYVRCRYFRQTLICRLGATLKRQLGPESVGPWYLASQATSTAVPSFEPGEVVEFKSPSGGLNCRSPLTIAAMLELGRAWPAPIAFDELFEKAKRGTVLPAESRSFFASEMLSGMAAGVIEWRLSPVGYTTTIGARPVASPLARHQAISSKSVANLRGESVDLDEIHRQIIRRLDGSADRAQLIEYLVTSLKSGQLLLRREGDDTPVTEEAEIRDLLDPALTKALENLARLSLLQASRAP